MIDKNIIYSLKNIDIQLKNKDFHIKKLKLYKNQIYGIIGNNGSGKTTFLNLLSFMLPISKTSEFYFYDNKVNYYEISKYINSVSYVMDNPIFINMSILDNLKLFVNKSNNFNNKIKKSDLDSILDSFLIDKKYLYYDDFSKLSKGIASRFFFMFIILLCRKILIIDEIVDSFDTDFKKFFFNKKNLLNLSKDVILIVSHDIDLLKSISDEIICIENIYKRR